MTGRVVLLLLVFLPFLLSVHARAEERVRFEPLGLSQGLDVKVVPSMLVDRSGFLWAATREGLYRYDGYEARRIPSGELNASALPDSDLRALFEDSAGRLWIASNTAGLSRYDPITGSFRNFRHDSSNNHTLSHDSIYGMAEDRDGNIWAGSQIGLNRLDPETGTVRRFLHDPEDLRSISHDYVYTVLADSAGNLWIGTVGGGINIRRAEGDGFEHIDLAGELEGHSGLNDVFAFAQGPDGKIYAGTRAGMVAIEPDAGTFHKVETSPGGGPTLITDMEWGPDGRLWLATMSLGVIAYDPDTGAVVAANPDLLGLPGQLPALPQMSIAISGEKIFVGTWGSGVYHGRYSRARFDFIDADREESRFRNRNVKAVHVQDGGTAWVGTFGGGIQPLLTEKNRAGEIAGEPPALKEDGVLDIERRRDGTLAVATVSGIWLLEPDGHPREFIDTDSGQGLGHGYVTSIAEDAQGNLWAGIGGSGVYRLPAGGETFEAFTHDPANTRSLSGNYISDLAVVGEGLLLVGTRSSGLNLCHTESWSCQRVGAEQGLGHHNITSLLPMGSSQVWVGTYGGGLHHFRIDSGKLELIRRWTEQDGLLSDGVMGIGRDDDGSLWISSRKGLSRLQPSNAAIINHVAESGLPVTHFNARTVDRDEKFLYFGGLGGLVKVPVGTSMRTRLPSPVRLVELNRPDSEGRLATRPAYALDSFATNWGEPLTVSYASLDYAGGNHEYQYRLAQDENWQSLGSRRYLTLLGLAPGTHYFSVRGRDAFGNWSESPALTLEVTPPFWMTSWFRVIAALMLMLLVWGWHRIRVTGLRRRNAVLEQLQVERERALAQAKESQVGLRQAHAGLRSLTNRLETAREEQRQQISRELHDELGQTLTAAKISLQRLGRTTEPAQASGLLEAAVGMMDSMIAQVRNISLSLRPPLLDEAGLEQALQVHLDSVAERADVDIRYEYSGDLRAVSKLARTTAFRLVQESVNNALRHSRANAVQVSLNYSDLSLDLTVADNGCGFDPETVWLRVHRGEHLGLLGMLERAQAAGGELSFDSSPGRGCRITAKIPI